MTREEIIAPCPRGHSAHLVDSFAPKFWVICDRCNWHGPTKRSRRKAIEAWSAPMRLWQEWRNGKDVTSMTAKPEPPTCPWCGSAYLPVPLNARHAYVMVCDNERCVTRDHYPTREAALAAARRAPSAVAEAERACVDALTDDLFRNGSGDCAVRLVLVDDDGRDLGGWCREAMRDRILAALERASERTR